MTVSKAAELVANRTHSIYEDCGDYDLLKKVLKKAFPKDKEGDSYVFSTEDDKFYGYCSHEEGNWANVGHYLTYLQGISLSEINEDEEEVESQRHMKEGLRFNEGKTRHDLVPQFAQEQYAKVLTKGSDKYAERNWELGMKWSKVTASLKRHTLAFESGEDFDPETGCLHTAHIMCNAGFLTEYYKIYPQGDDRPHKYLKKAKIGLDIDEVLADWVGHWTRYHGQEVPENWNFDRNISDKFESLKDDKEFWLSIPVKTQPSDIHFEPHCYITSRSIPVEWTMEWLDRNGFPTMPVYSIGFGQSKVDVAKESGIDIYVDDRYENFVELNNAGICTFLFDAPHNQRYDVGYKRIKSISELN